MATIISPKTDSVTEYLSLRSVIGKKVYSKSGEYIGKISDILYSSNQMVGFTIGNGKNMVYIDKDYFDKSPQDVQMLNIDPVIMMKGKSVFDSLGREVGKVCEVIRQSSRNEFTSLMVKKNPFSKPIEIKPKDIAGMKKNVLLNRSI